MDELKFQEKFQEFQNSKTCTSQCTPQCREKGGAQSTFGIHRNGERFIFWCGLCAKKEFAERAISIEQQTSRRKMCIACKTSQPNYGLPDENVATYCKKCLTTHCTSMGIDLDSCVDFIKRNALRAKSLGPVTACPTKTLQRIVRNV
jgi:hypothetical protein